MTAVPAPAPIRPTPLLRGAIHAGALPLVLATGIVLVVLAPDPATRVALVLYGLCAAALFAASATYHLSRASGRSGQLLQRLDHAAIFLIIAGTYTPFLVVALSGVTQALALGFIWIAAAGGVVVRLTWGAAPRWFFVSLYVALGWTAVAVFPQLLDGAGIAPVVLAIAGGAIYSVGALVYALRTPDLFPSTFGFHELFHLLTVGAFACLDVGVWLVVHGPH